MGENVNSDFIRGHIDTIILRILLLGDNYGYEIVKLVRMLSKGAYELKEPSLYTSLKRLEKNGLISSYWGDETMGGRRKYYRITEAGKNAYDSSISEWILAREIIDLLILPDTGM